MPALEPALPGREVRCLRWDELHLTERETT
jgi:hypothetical protein